MSARCPKCWSDEMGCNSGEVDQQGFLDCLCGAADEREKFQEAIYHVENEKLLSRNDLLWFVHQRAVEQERAKVRAALDNIRQLAAAGNWDAIEATIAEMRRVAP